MDKKTTCISIIILCSIIGANIPISSQNINEAPTFDTQENNIFRKITIDKENIDETLTNFPILIKLDSDNNLDTYAQADGDDIQFWSIDNNTQYNHEIECYDNGTLDAWVNVTSISATTDTELWMKYGDESATNQENVSGTWDNGYLMVLHMNENSGTRLDSTTNDNDATPYADTTYNSSGVSGGCTYYDGVGDHLETTSMAPGSNYTVEFWFNDSTRTGSAYEYPFSWGTYGTVGSHNVFMFESNGLYYSNLDTGGSETSEECAISGDLSDGEWHYYACRVHATNNWIHYIDMVNEGGQDEHPSPNNKIHIGGREDNNSDRFYDGRIDELRISQETRSAAWLSATYDAITDDTMVTVGPASITNNSAPITKDPDPADESEHISTTQSTWNITIEDPDGDTFNWTIETSPDVGNNSGTNDTNGTKQVTIDGLENATIYQCYVNVSDAFHTTNDVYTFTTECPEECTYRKITINHSYIDETLTNFPILVSTDNDDNIRINAQADGDDINFWSYTNNTRLKHEIEYYNQGTLRAWVNVTSIASDQDTFIWMKYGNATVPSQENINETWGNNYEVVLHMNENSGTRLDSTANDHDATPYADTTVNNSGLVGNCIYLDGDTDHLETDVVSLGGTYTVEFWFNDSTRSGNDSYEYPFSMGNYDATNSHNTFIHEQDGTLYSRLDTATGSEPMDIAGDVVDGSWHYYACRVDDVENWVHYLDGVNEGGDDEHPSPNTKVFIGGRADNNTDRFYSGRIDEVRLSTVRRSEAWLNATYATITEPDFMQVEAAETTGNSAPITKNPSPADGTTKVDISLAMWNITIEDPDGDTFNWTIETRPDVGNNSGTTETNGSKNVTLSSLAYDTEYTVYVNATDSTAHETAETYTFTTEEQNQTPVISNPSPDNGQTGVTILWSTWSATIEDPEGDTFNWTIETSPDVGNNSGTNDTNGTKQTTLNGLTNSTTYTIYVNTTDQGSDQWNNETYTFTTANALDAEMTYMRYFIIESDYVEKTLYNFTIYLNIQNDGNLSEQVQADGDDIQFWKCDNTSRYSYELDNYQDGNLSVWVKIPTIYADQDTWFCMKYGNDTCGSQEERTNAWDNNYEAVFHLDELTGNRNDSTSNTHSAIPYADATYNQSGITDGCVQYDGVSDCLITDAIQPGSNYTVEFWFKDSTRTGAYYEYPFSWGTYGSADSHNVFIDESNGGLYSNLDTGGSATSVAVSTGDVVTGEWTYYHARVYHANDWVHGIDETIEGGNDEHPSPNTSIHLGGRSDNDSARFYDGLMDEVRISKTPRSDEWVETTYYLMTQEDFIKEYDGSMPVNITTVAATNITPNSAVLHANVTDTGDTAVSVWYEYDDYVVPYGECIGIIATGNVTYNNWSINWKNRHWAGAEDQQVYYFEGDNYSFWGAGPQGTAPGGTGHYCRMGQNEKGLAITYLVGGSGSLENPTHQSDGVFGFNDNNIRAVLGNYSTVKDAAEAMLNHNYYTGQGWEYAITSAEPGVGAIVDIDSTGAGKMIWVNNTWRVVANSFMTENDTEDAYHINGIKHFNDIVDNGTGVKGNKIHVIDVLNYSRNCNGGRFEDGDWYDSSGSWTAQDDSRLAQVSLTGSNHKNESMYISFISGGHTHLAPYLPIYAGNMHSQADIPANFTNSTFNHNKGLEYFTDFKESYCRNGATNSTFYKPRVLEVLNYTQKNDEYVVNEFESLMEKLNTQQNETNIREMLDIYANKTQHDALQAYVNKNTEHTTKSNKYYPVTNTHNKTITGLKPGTTYYFRAWANNSIYEGNGSTLYFITPPNTVKNVNGTAYSTSANITWEKDETAMYTYIERKNDSSAPWQRGEGTIVYNGTAEYLNETLATGNKYHYQLWTYAYEDIHHENLSAYGDFVMQNVTIGSYMSIRCNRTSWNISGNTGTSQQTLLTWANISNTGNEAVDVEISASNASVWYLKESPGYNAFNLSSNLGLGWNLINYSKVPFLLNFEAGQYKQFGLQVYLPTSASATKNQTTIITYTITPTGSASDCSDTQSELHTANTANMMYYMDYMEFAPTLSALSSYGYTPSELSTGYVEYNRSADGQEAGYWEATARPIPCDCDEDIGRWTQTASTGQKVWRNNSELQTWRNNLGI